MEELLARLRSIVRRSAGHASSVVEAGEITLDERQMKVSLRGVPVSLSPLEYRLVAYLLLHRGRVVSQHELDENVYGHGEDHDSNALEVLIGRVRKKLGAESIETRRGFGYLIPEPPA
jgi:DNA-binding response OmpR family regulator